MSLRPNPQKMEALLGAHQSGWSLNRLFYTDPAIFDLDIEKIFMRCWLCAGHSSRIPKPGDYFIFEIANESIILIPGEDGAIHALFNVCRHRGSRICTEGSGHTRKLICPYHQWVYGTDRALLSARLMPPEFALADFGLHRVQCRVSAGLTQHTRTWVFSARQFTMPRN